MPPQQWARLQTDVNVKLRRGAWYRILKLGPLEAVVEVNRRPLTVARTLLQIVQAPPTRWTIVAAPRNSTRVPSSWGERYAVCPGCRDRAPLVDRPTSMRCQRCNGLFDVAWDEHYLEKV